MSFKGSSKCIGSFFGKSSKSPQKVLWEQMRARLLETGAVDPVLVEQMAEIIQETRVPPVPPQKILESDNKSAPVPEFTSLVPK